MKRIGKLLLCAVFTFSLASGVASAAESNVKQTVQSQDQSVNVEWINLKVGEESHIGIRPVVDRLFETEIVSGTSVKIKTFPWMKSMIKVYAVAVSEGETVVRVKHKFSGTVTEKHFIVSR
ncbi:hypothetical protein SAMN04487970_10799 [Paenibacillus tianmuensis]|uniref:Uncharacterized protein n=1 Tax=Paenibacillus tianmuensis TaxID=624147 RepID=A0A1G4TYL2_9BACL|nr:hypothetical protein [Paenibacillus tianmuensis]SCW86428.1 hypothetical protein SAMN04487970_10799 [Paenibacillus tianmuensis]